LTTEASLGDQEVATALALVFDTSKSMEYTEKGKNRLEEAQVHAREILRRTTDDSEVFVLDSARPNKPQAVSPAAAQKQIDALTLQAAYRPLNAALVRAAEAVAASNLPRREIYVLTDMASSAWDLAGSKTSEELEKLRKDKSVYKTYVLRLTPKAISDVAVVSAEPSSTVAAEGEPIEIKATLRCSGSAVSRVAEFWLDGDNKRGQKIVELPASGEAEVAFLTPPKLETGLHQGRIKLAGGDNLPFDDTRYFSFNVQPPLRVLVVADRFDDQDLGAFFVLNALSPEPSPGLGTSNSAVRVERESQRKFQARTKLSTRDFAAVFLLDVDRPSPTEWGMLSAYVREGGGLVVAPGVRAQAAAYEGSVPASLLPATLDVAAKLARETAFGKAEYDHPLFNRHAKQLDTELGLWPVYRYWKVKPSDASRTLLAYLDGAPALLERVFKGPKTGHVLLWTTPLSRQPLRDDPAAWNEFPQSWAFVDLLTQTIPYLAGTAGERLNYEAGQDAVLPIEPAQRAPTYTVRGPDPKVVDRLSAPATSDSLLIPAPSKEGQWKVEGQGPDGSAMKLGFSVNVSPLEAQFVELKPGQLENVFGGKDHFVLVDNAEKLADAQVKGRIGIELFPWMMFLILALVTFESVLANRFHRESAPAATSAATVPTGRGALT
jgi:hypothetical protein